MANSTPAAPSAAKTRFSMFLFAILAGFCIGLGGTVFLRIKDAFPGGNVVGAFLFGIGLFVICTRGYNLFTGKACYLFDNPPSYILDLIIIWIGNLLGTGLLAGLEHLTGICGETGINAAAEGLVTGKMNANLLSLFVLGILCNVFIFIAVIGFAKLDHPLLKCFSLFLGVMIFILCGTEHSVADMYYWWVSGIFTSNFGPSLGRILIITLGNVVGGVFFPLMEKAVTKLKQA
ncbi:MAG: formate/nitrite transporter family protein [Lachnospiraceae bacterium]|nr:formate/nitrite transporter family protein [Lachnospiraceae bacterium]